MGPVKVLWQINKLLLTGGGGGQPFIGLCKYRSCNSLCLVTAVYLDLLQDDVNDNFVGKRFKLKYFLACWCRCRKSKS